MMINLFHTIRFNLRAFGLWRGLRLPVYVYSPLKIYSIGRIEIKSPLRRGMWKLGMHHDNSALPYTIFDNRGTIELHGRAWLHHGCRLTNSGLIIFQGNDIISHECVLDIRERLEFGRNVSVGFGSEFCDSDMHFMVDVRSREVHANRKPISIGSFNWFGSHTYIKKGTRTPDYTTVASPNAVLLRDYTADVQPYSILAGSPAHVIAQGKVRIFNFKNEVMIRSFMENCDGKEIFHIGEDRDLDDFCAISDI